jgi:hypothetical protein
VAFNLPDTFHALLTEPILTTQFAIPDLLDEAVELSYLIFGFIWCDHVIRFGKCKLLTHVLLKFPIHYKDISLS